MRHLFIFFSLLIFAGCSGKHGHTWTDQEIKDFECKCNQTDTFNNVVFMFDGFSNDEFDSILIKKYKDTILLDSFKMYVFPSQSPRDIEHKMRSGTVDKTMSTKYKYQFIIPGQRPYELANMKMILWGMYPGYGCEMGDFTMDGIRYRNVGNPQIQKWNSKPHALQLMQGEWISEQDSLSVVEISDRKWNFKYKGSEDQTFHIDIVTKLPQYVDTTVKAEFIILTKENDTIYSEILGLSDSVISLMHYPSMHRNLYVRRKITIH